VVAELPETGPADPAPVFAVVSRWRRFWATSQNGLSREQQLGLVGELWLLLEWLPAVTTRALSAWQGPVGGRHDWVTDRVSVEVKTTGTTMGPVVHRIGRLDQLDEPSAGQLYLLSIRAIPDPLGIDSLTNLLGRARTAAASVGTTCEALLDDRLRAVGITHADEARYTDRLRVAGQELYRVTQGFPRLTPASFPQGLPAGITDLAYSLDTSACAAWLVARRPDDTDLLKSLA
jgi:hypothetical protein